MVIVTELPLIYSTEGQQDLNFFFSVMRSYLIERASRLGFAIVNLRPVMIDQFRSNGRHFEYSDDNHWSANGYR